eukprot:gnl/TRDRNA2_/TRDRNA2_155875_c1_seq3.p2 gnl/TRDRNA2_/TRDRNA2_155875_c1~~gnl/TRDRNA2_/TRDRNA2_155875_c1_seq3.p2  ORF type:complete len:224 (+),score=57.53 gnl/TRDRNA2_/TRDRNA2_155875_c1_seq3:561-1232(+)
MPTTITHVSQGTKPPAELVAFAPTVMQTLLRFAELDTMQQLILVVSAHLTSDLAVLRESPQWYELFCALDVNDDGRLSYAELCEGMKLLLSASNELTLSDEKLDEAARALDFDSSGSLEWVEWVAASILALGESRSNEDLEPLSSVLRLLDRPSCDGVVGVADLEAVCAALGPHAPQDVQSHINHALERWSSNKKQEGDAPALAFSDLRWAFTAGLRAEAGSS